MTDYKAEQEMELEALQAILMDELTELEGLPPPDWPSDTVCYRVAIKTEEEVAAGAYEKKMDLIFAHTPNYPDEPPRLKLSSVQGLTAKDLKEIDTLLEEQVQANMGMAMIFTMVSALQEWLAEQVAGVRETAFEVDPKELERREQEAEERRLAEIRAHGTPVTVDTFAAWKRTMDAQKQMQRAQLDPDAANKDKGPSGKAFFLAQEANGAQTEEDQSEVDSEESEEDEDFDEEDADEDEDEDELLDQILAAKQNR